MMGHLVFGRYGSEGMVQHHASPPQSGWMSRMLSALFRRH